MSHPLPRAAIGAVLLATLMSLSTPSLAQEASATATAATAATTGTTAFTSTQLTILGLVNQARAVARVCGTTQFPAAAPLTLNARLNQAAQGHATDMATNNYFSHTSLDGRSPWTRITSTGYKYRYAAENIAAGYSTAALVVQGWLNSPGHCRNIMNGNLKELGVGYAYSATARYHHYWVNDFATPY